MLSNSLVPSDGDTTPSLNINKAHFLIVMLGEAMLEFNSMSMVQANEFKVIVSLVNT